MRNRALPNTVRRALYQPSLWGDTYLTPQEARVYLTQMLTMLAKAREAKGGTK